MRRGEFITLVAQWGRKEGTGCGLTTLATTLAAYRLRKATLEPPLRYLMQQESSNAPLSAQSEASMTPEANISALCHEFTNALTEVLAENAVGLARRGRIARAHAAVKRHSEYDEHALCVAVEAAFVRWEALQNNAPPDTEISQAVTRRTAA
jgi:hypothetical protein